MMTAPSTPREQRQRVSNERVARAIDVAEGALARAKPSWAKDNAALDRDIGLDLLDARATIAQRDAEIAQLREALATARRDGWIAGRQATEKFFEEEIRSAKEQIEDNDRHVARVGGDAWPANRLCHQRISRCDQYLTFIRTLAPPASADGGQDD